MVNFGVDTYFPVPFMKQNEGYRLSAFIDGGSSFEDSINTSDLRYSAGLGAVWLSPFGPLSDNDQTEKFQFGMGSSF